MYCRSKHSRIFAAGFIIFLFLTGFSEEKLLLEQDFSKNNRFNWVDDGKYANSPSKFYYWNSTHSEKPGLEISFQGMSQVFTYLPALKKGTVYRIEIDMKAAGQVESYGFSFRMIPSPWSKYGGKGQKVQLNQWDRLVFELRMPTDLPKNRCGLFFGASGSGSILLSKIRITEQNDFSLGKENISSQNILENSKFNLFHSGWVLEKGASIQNKTCIFPGKIIQEKPFRLFVNRPYILRIAGSGTGNIAYSVHTPLPPWTSLTKGSAQFRAGMIEHLFLLSQPHYGVRLDDGNDYVLEVSSNQKMALSEIAVLQPEYGIRFPEEIRTKQHNVSFGSDIKGEIAVDGIPVGTKVDLTISDHRKRILKTIPLTIRMLNPGQPGSDFSFKADFTGWVELKLRYQNCEFNGLPGELVILPVKKTENNPAGDFVFGSHLRYSVNKKGIGEVLSGHKIRLAEAKNWGINAVRLHPPLSTKWWAVQNEKNGKFNFQDSIVDGPREFKMSVLGLLDGTAKYASSAPQQVLEKNDAWLGYGAYPAKDIHDWENYVRNMVTHFRGRITEWEIWNEPDHFFFRLNPAQHQSKSDEYMRILISAYKTAKQADPNCKIVAGAVTAGGKNFLLECIGKGMLNFCDAISFHGYGRQNGSHVYGAKAFEDIVSALNQAAEKQGIKPKEIWDSEGSSGMIQEGIKGSFASELNVKSIIARRAAGIKRFYCYNGFTKDRPGHGDHRMLLGYNGHPLVIQGLLAAYDRVLGNSVYMANLGDDSAGIHVYAFKQADGSKVLAGWYSGKNATYDFQQKEILSGFILNSAGNKNGTFSNGTLPLTDELCYYGSDH